MRRDSPPARQMPGDYDRQHSENHDHCQSPAPPAGLAVPAMAQDVIHNPHHLEQPMPAQGRYVGQPGLATGQRLGILADRPRGVRFA